jgi:hypothetical protein
MNGIKRRARRAGTTTLALTGVLTAVAFAWLAVPLLEGEGSSKTGKHAAPQTLALTVTESPATGLTPMGQVGGVEKEEVSAVGENTSGAAFHVTGATVTTTDSNEVGCPVSNFKVSGGSGISGERLGTAAVTYETPVAIAATSKAPITLSKLAEIRLAAGAPTACEEVTFKVKVVAATGP